MSKDLQNFDRIKKFLTKEQIAKYYSSQKESSTVKKESLLEDSSILAEYIIYENISNTTRFKNINDLKEYFKIKGITKYNFGDLLSFDQYRDIDTKIIGKNGVLVSNPDYSGSGYLTIPFEITQYLDDATNKYKDIDVSCIDLRHDDKFIKENIGEIPKSWNFKFTKTDDDIISVEFPNRRVNDFEIGSTNAQDIYDFYLGSQKEQATIKLYYSIKGEKYKEFRDKYGYKTVPDNLLKTWSVEYGSGGGGSNSTYGNLKFKGPFDEISKILDILNQYYDGFDAQIQVTQ